MVLPSIHLPTTGVTFGWDRTHEPLLVVRSGEEIVVDVEECTNGQVKPGATADIIANLDFSQIDPISGPIVVEGARPGDVLQVDLLETRVGSYGFAANYPGSGLLPDDFPDPWVYVFDLDGGARARYVHGASIPLEPMVGVVGCTPAAPGPHSSIPPARVGGNMDIKHVRAGTTVYLPIEVEGALFGIGDPHAAQGDGEVGGSGIECPMTIRFRLTVRRDLSLSFPFLEVRHPLERPSAARAGYTVTTGIGTDLYDAAREAIRGQIRRLVAQRGFEPIEAYELCSLAADLKISEIVNHPSYVVSAFLPNDLFLED